MNTFSAKGQVQFINDKAFVVTQSGAWVDIDRIIKNNFGKKIRVEIKVEDE